MNTMPHQPKRPSAFQFINIFLSLLATIASVWALIEYRPTTPFVTGATITPTSAQISTKTPTPTLTATITATSAKTATTTPTTTLPAPNFPVPAGSILHFVQPGEDIHSIEIDYALSPFQIQWFYVLNSTIDPFNPRLIPGQRIIVPGPTILQLTPTPIPAAIETQIEGLQTQVAALQSPKTQNNTPQGVSSEIAGIENRQEILDNRLTTIEAAINDDPNKILSIPLIQNDIKSLSVRVEDYRDQTRRDINEIKIQIQRDIDDLKLQNYLILGALLTLGLNGLLSGISALRKRQTASRTKSEPKK